ncbi:tetratricopeptide repeat protein [Stratiformator vulcanicus]|uniref:Tetratricopeptide repeat protein n=1 Tax=Stratiformator vulcanicus TaxID=2527980 RepID=A0A517R548_9PLAN|nr:hypothetical protein [Stratiformator vulcanicus]QDT38943.1 Tetratricopeptide repeat protein [Stratiformator vulcanicus]
MFRSAAITVCALSTAIAIGCQSFSSEANSGIGQLAGRLNPSAQDEPGRDAESLAGMLREAGYSKRADQLLESRDAGKQQVAQAPKSVLPSNSDSESPSPKTVAQLGGAPAISDDSQRDLILPASHEIEATGPDSLSTPQAPSPINSMAKGSNFGAPPAHHRLAVAADLQGDFAAADHHYDAALRERPQDADLLSDIGYSYLLRSDYPASERYLHTALSIEPHHERAAHNLSLLYAKLGDFGRAESVLSAIVSPAEIRTRMAVLRDSLDSSRGASRPENNARALAGSPALSPVSSPSRPRAFAAAPTDTPPAWPHSPQDSFDQSPVVVQRTAARPLDSFEDVQRAMRAERKTAISARQSQHESTTAPLPGDVHPARYQRTRDMTAASDTAPLPIRRTEVDPHDALPLWNPPINDIPQNRESSASVHRPSNSISRADHEEPRHYPQARREHDRSSPHADRSRNHPQPASPSRFAQAGHSVPVTDRGRASTPQRTAMATPRDQSFDYASHAAALIGMEAGPTMFPMIDDEPTPQPGYAMQSEPGYGSHVGGAGYAVPAAYQPESGQAYPVRPGEKINATNRAPVAARDSMLDQMHAHRQMPSGNGAYSPQFGVYSRPPQMVPGHDYIGSAAPVYNSPPPELFRTGDSAERGTTPAERPKRYSY